MGQRQSATVGVEQTEQADDPPVMVVEEVDSSFGPESEPADGVVAAAERVASTGGHDTVVASTADAAAPHDGVSEEEEALWQVLIHSPAALADSAGISAERLHELFVRAAEVAAAEADELAPKAGSQYRAGALREAAAAGNLDQVMSHLQAGSDPNAISEQLAEWGPLHYAAQRGHTSVVSALLDAGTDPLARDTSTGETALTQAQYWGHTEVAEILAARGGSDAGPADVVPVVLSRAQDKALSDGWFTCLGMPVWRTRRILPSSTSGANLTQLICSAPEFTIDATDEHHAVMVRLFALCDKSHGVKFGYDWGGSATAEAADADPNRRVRTCCYSLACSCEVKGHWITGPVDWRNPKSVRGSMWFPKYKTKVMASIQAEAQAQAGNAGDMIEIVIIKGGPVSQLELRTLPGVVTSAVADLKKKGVDIALAGEFGAEEIQYTACFPLCCFQSPAKKLFSLHKRKKETTTVFLRTYEAAEYFEMWKKQDSFARREKVQGWIYLIGLLASLVWMMNMGSVDDASDSCPWKNDGQCDEGWGKTPRCPPGTDMEDCCSDPGPLTWALMTAGGAQCNTSTTCVFD